MIALTTTQFVCIIGLSGGQLAMLFGIFLRLGRLIVGHAEHDVRILQLERART